jgi:hypothetical protein
LPREPWGREMRWLVLIASFSLAGCAGAIDAATKAGTTVANLRSALGADIDLEQALLKNTAYKSAELAFVSLGKYTCGDPTDPYTRMATTLELTDAQRAAAKAKWSTKKDGIEKTLRKQYAAIEVIMAYGDSLAAVAKGFAEVKTATDGLKSAIDAYKSFATGEVAIAVTAFEDTIGLIQTAAALADTFAVVAIAKKMEKKLADAENAITKGDALKRLTADEAIAFKTWDSCAQERLRFIRDFNPAKLSGDRVWSEKPRYLEVKLAGEGPTAVLQFATEYKAYLDEREAFVGQRPDYKSLIHAIVEANSAIANAKPEDVLSGLAFLGKAASDLNAASETVRKDIKKLNT